MTMKASSLDPSAIVDAGRRALYQPSVRLTRGPRFLVMAGLGPAIHVFADGDK
jgi:hypothetical protein